MRFHNCECFVKNGVCVIVCVCCVCRDLGFDKTMTQRIYINSYINLESRAKQIVKRDLFGAVDRIW